MLDEILTLLWTVLVVVLVLILAYVFTRFVVGRASGRWTSGGGQKIRVLERVPIGKDQKLLLVQLGEEYQFLGVTSGMVTCLRRVSEEEAMRWQQEEAKKPQPMSFQESLRQVLEQRKNKGGH